MTKAKTSKAGAKAPPASEKSITPAKGPVSSPGKVEGARDPGPRGIDASKPQTSPGGANVPAGGSAPAGPGPADAAGLSAAKSGAKAGELNSAPQDAHSITKSVHNKPAESINYEQIPSGPAIQDRAAAAMPHQPGFQRADEPPVPPQENPPGILAPPIASAQPNPKNLDEGQGTANINQEGGVKPASTDVDKAARAAQQKADKTNRSGKAEDPNKTHKITIPGEGSQPITVDGAFVRFERGKSQDATQAQMDALKRGGIEFKRG